MTLKAQFEEEVRLAGVMAFVVFPDNITLGMMYENRAMSIAFEEGLWYKVNV